MHPGARWEQCFGFTGDGVLNPTCMLSDHMKGKRCYLMCVPVVHGRGVSPRVPSDLTSRVVILEVVVVRRILEYSVLTSYYPSKSGARKFR